MPRNGTPSPCTRVGERADEVLLDQRVDGGAGGADAREDDAVGRRDLGRGRGQPGREPEVLEGVEHARRVAGAVVDDVDHARPRVANALRPRRTSLNRERPDPPMTSVMRPRRTRSRLALVIAPLLALLLALAGCSRRRRRPRRRPRRRRTARPDRPACR